MDGKQITNTTKTETSAKQNPRHKRKFLGAQMGFLRIAIPSLGTVLLAVGGVLASYFPHILILGLSFVASGAFCFILVVNLNWRNTHTRQQPLGGPWSRILLGATIISPLMGAYLSFLPRAQPTAFRISCDSALSTSGRPLLTTIMVEYPTKYGPTISPVHYTLLVTIVNLQSVPSMLESYSLAARGRSGCFGGGQKCVVYGRGKRKGLLQVLAMPC
jgi:hypothetical protein